MGTVCRMDTVATFGKKVLQQSKRLYLAANGHGRIAISHRAECPITGTDRATKDDQLIQRRVFWPVDHEQRLSGQGELGKEMAIYVIGAIEPILPPPRAVGNEGNGRKGRSISRESAQVIPMAVRSGQQL